MLPKYLLADNSLQSPGKLYVVHNEHPRFIIEGSEDDFSEDQSIYWIDDAIDDEDKVSELIGGAEDFLDEELDNQEELYDVSMN